MPALRNFDFAMNFFTPERIIPQDSGLDPRLLCKGTKKHQLSIIFFWTYFHLHISIIFRQELGIQPAYHQFVAPWYIWRKLITGNKTAGSQLSNFFLIKKRTLAITTQNVIGRKTLWFTSRLYCKKKQTNNKFHGRYEHLSYNSSQTCWNTQRIYLNVRRSALEFSSFYTFWDVAYLRV